MTALAPYYFYFKFFHVFFVMMWAMSAVGAYIFYLRSTIYQVQKTPDDKELQKRLIWAYEQFDKTVILEHIAFPIVLITGLLMFLGSSWSLDNTWLLIKLLIVCLVFIPMEIFDYWIAHVHGPRVSRNREEDPEAWNSARELHWKFLKTTAPIVRYTVPIVIFLVVVKPSF